MTTFSKDQIVFRGDAQFRVVRTQGLVAQLENIATGEFTNHNHDDLLEEYMRGYLRPANTKQYRSPRRETNGDEKIPLSMDELTEVARSNTRRRISYIVGLEREEAFGTSRKDLRKAILKIASELADPRPPAECTVYKWRKRYRVAQLDVGALFDRVDLRGGRGKPRLDRTVDAIIHEKIETVFLSAKTGSAEEIHNAVFLAIQVENAGRPEADWLKAPGLRTIQRRLGEVNAYDRALARYGEREASRRFANHLGARNVTRILEIVEIDHSPVDALVVDENGVVIGRPVLTVVFDRYSRCVLGYSLSLAGFGVHAVFEALRHALLPKTYLRRRYPEMELTWDCHGWFELLLMDNGREFHSRAVEDALINLSILSEFAASRDPNDKPFVERFLKTFNYSFIHRLPGTTLAKVHERIGFKAEDEACLTLEQLNQLIHVWITSVYHMRPHRGLSGKAPVNVWRESAQAYPPLLKCNAEDLDIEFSSLEESVLQHYGIDLNTFTYVSEDLLALRRLLPPKSKVAVKAPYGNAGFIWVWNPIEKAYIKADNKDQSYADLTIEQAKLAKKVLADGPDYQRTIADAQEIIRQKSEQAMSDPKLSIRKKGARMANKTAKDQNREVAEKMPAATTQPSHSSPGADGVLADFESESIGQDSEV
ncbi:integrase [Paraburkholderia aspalathi]|uniref:integrase n=1 Tax=Paraburkholderia aspalathi TaxID=1324617 RepID=UPI0038BDC524